MSKLSLDHNSRDENDPGLETLLGMNGDIYEQGGGYYIKIVAHAVTPDATRPEGVDYSLTLHAPSGDRLLGYDNAHPVNTASGPAGKRKKSNHHIHRTSNVRPYKFEGAQKLLDDFLDDVDKILKAEGVVTL